MRLYLKAESKNKIGYTPDFIQVSYEENETVYELDFDIQGWVDYDNDGLDCRCKGELTPWVLRNVDTDEEINLYELETEEYEEMFPTKRIAEIFENGFEFLVGIYPVNDETFEDNDTVSEGTGKIELYFEDEDRYYSKEFSFDTETSI